MTTFTNEALLPLTTYGIPSGNYNGSTPYFFGNSVPAANFYAGQGFGQTVIVQFTSFQGNVTLQGSLNDWHEQAMWSDIEKIESPAPSTNTITLNIEGNFVWLRAFVEDFAAGTINTANVIY